mmetsp:Transcript_19841/g.29816  ORF Transcript_19841/g.29816 Transcript_19841/m.29816 type:complete len:82 (+) Transcript_19841:702-947(+)
MAVVRIMGEASEIPDITSSEVPGVSKISAGFCTLLKPGKSKPKKAISRVITAIDETLEIFSPVCVDLKTISEDAKPIKQSD